MKCAICGTEESIINHHTSYDPEETVPLCRSCHMKLHNGSIKSDIPAPTLPYPIHPTVQISKVDDKKIKFLVEQGHFLNRTDFTRIAVRTHLKNFSFPDNLEAE